MIVARSFSPPSSSHLSEKYDLTGRGTRSSLSQRSRSPQRRSAHSPSRLQPTPPPMLKSRSEPVKIPSRNSKNALSHAPTRPSAVVIKGNTHNPNALHVPAPVSVPNIRLRKESAQEILSSTAIPVRRRPRGRPSQRLPATDYVAEFSKLLCDDIQPNKDGVYSRSRSLSQTEGLFGHIDELVEGQMIVGSEGLDDSCLSARSISSESLASLASPDDYSPSHIESRSNTGRSPQGRQLLRVSHSTDCTSDHPLAELDEEKSKSLSSLESSPSESFSRPISPPRTSKKEPLRSSFKSTLTSSLKALKSAARTTLLSSSGFGPHGASASPSLYTNESLLAHNFFDIQPSLTDDRRPPPSMVKPSPELRRYLNPQMASAPPDSPTQLHFWQEERQTCDAKRETQILKEKLKQRQKRKRSPTPRSKIDSLPLVVPLSTCLPPTVRTANASSPPIWLTPDGEPINKHTSSALLSEPVVSTLNGGVMPKNREPRENRDFLRMFVGEMAMRRNGKLSDDLSAGRARLWLPPLAGFQTTSNGVQPTRKEGAERWQSLTADEI